MMTIVEIRKYCIEAFDRAGYSFDNCNIDILINGRLKTTLGRCHSEYINGILIPTRIEISRQLLETCSIDSIVDVIFHEAAHALVAIETGENHGHDRVFKQMCARIGTDNDTTTTNVERTVEDKEIFKYFVRCSKCGDVLAKYHRAGKVVKNATAYTSKCCGASILIQTNW